MTEDPFADWAHVCETCGELLQPTLHLGSLATPQWLHLDVQIDHAPVPRLLPPGDES